jgi:exodeoxyribonuclease VII large subunit
MLVSDRLDFSPTDAVALINQTFEVAYGIINVVGDISDIRVSRDKWLYFSVVDEYSSLKCFGTVYGVTMTNIEEGANVRITGQPRLHPKYGFSINVMQVELLNKVDLNNKKNLLNKKINELGLNSSSRKRSLPEYPSKIALVTSVGSAAEADFVKVAASRWPIQISVFDSIVQGVDGPASVVNGLFNANNSDPDIEFVVLCRGGGSASDLDVFDDESVVMAVAGSRLPVVVAIGHETDNCLAESVSDLRASTPSNAAELVIPDRKSELEELRWTLEESKKSFINKIVVEQNYLNSIKLLCTRSSIQGILDKGFAIIYDQSGRLLRDVKNIAVGEKIMIKTSDATIGADIYEIR